MATFTYIEKETRKITKLFKNTKIKIAFRTRNTIQNIVKQHPQKDKYNDSGIYQMKCLDCPLKYVRKRAELSTPDTRSTYMQSGRITVHPWHRRHEHIPTQ
jgi:hypothetical protein